MQIIIFYFLNCLGYKVIHITFQTSYILFALCESAILPFPYFYSDNNFHFYWGVAGLHFSYTFSTAVHLFCEVTFTKKNGKNDELNVRMINFPIKLLDTWLINTLVNRIWCNFCYNIWGTRRIQYYYTFAILVLHFCYTCTKF